MRRTEAIAGGLLLIFSILGYQHSSMLVNFTQNTLGYSMKGLFSNNSLTNSQNMPQLRDQDSVTMTKIVQYGSLFLAIVGFAFLLYGIITKKSSSKEFGDISLETD